MDIDLKAAKIPKRGPGGVVCFHSLRHSFINILLEQGAGAKEVQDLARHQTLSMTMNHYAKSSIKRRRELAEGLGETIKMGLNPITGPERKVVGLETHDYPEGILAPRKQLYLLADILPLKLKNVGSEMSYMRPPVNNVREIPLTRIALLRLFYHQKQPPKWPRMRPNLN